MRIGACEHGGLLIELPARADAARHLGHQAGQLGSLRVRRMQPACRQLGNQRLDAAFSDLGDVDVAACAPGNAASLRALLTTGFSPLGSLQLFRRAPAGDPFMAKD